MSISEQSFSSMMSSKANNSDPILLTRSGIHKLKTNKNRFDPNSDSTVKQFTINNTTDSNSSISINETTSSRKPSPYSKNNNDKIKKKKTAVHNITNSKIITFTYNSIKQSNTEPSDNHNTSTPFTRTKESQKPTAHQRKKSEN